ncbi:MAG: type IV conjugative transfer system coupling protein TraD [Planctomycetes bacterium]|nr:type IV conjugative transfer system coupling protein TraD [Planctomycetota bacterium]
MANLVSRIHDFTRGGQTTLHTMRMLWQILRWMMRIYLILIACIFVYFLGFKSHSYYDRYLTLKYFQALLYADFNEKVMLVPFDEPNGGFKQVPARMILTHPEILKAKGRMKALAWRAGKVSGWLGVFLLFGLGTGFWWKGRVLRTDKLVRGGSIVTQKELRQLLKKQGRGVLSPYQLCNVPYLKNGETLHTLISGGPGQGKTVAIKDLIEQVRKQGDRAIIYDKMGVYLKEFYDPKTDIILNPLDARSPAWSVFAEGRTPSDYDTMAAALLPMHHHAQDPFWVNAARTIFAALAVKLDKEGKKDNHTFLSSMLNNDLAGLGELLKNTPAETLVNEKSDKTAFSVLSVLATYVKSLQYLPTEGSLFSIRQWVEAEKAQGFLFVSSRADQHETLKPLISMWLDVAVNQLLSLEQSVSRRFWVILDELPSLHQLPSLKPGLAETRQFGGSFVISIQTISQLREIYGKDGADAMSGLCSNRLVFKSPEPETAEWASKSLGRVEMDEVKEGFSYGANEMRDGVSLASNKTLRSLVLDTEILNLNPLEGYLKFSGNMPVAKICLKPKNRKTVVARFIPVTAAMRESSNDVARDTTRIKPVTSDESTPQRKVTMIRIDTKTAGLADINQNWYNDEVIENKALQVDL